MKLKTELEKQGNWLFRHRSYLPLIILLTALFVFIQTNVNKEITPVCRFAFQLLCLGVSLIGLFIRIYTVGYTPKNTSGRNTTEGQVADMLNTTGIYSIVRHPLYLGNFFMWLGTALLTGNSWFIVCFIFAFWIYYERIIFAEEQFLERKFGIIFSEWAKEVPTFVPNIAKFKKNSHVFSIRKVIWKEKNGLLALFLLFTLFDIMGEFLKGHRHHYSYFFLICSLLSLALYTILKIVKVKI